MYPTSVKTIADQLTAKKLTWKGYMEDMASPCLHPEIGGKDPYVVAVDQRRRTGAYATRHNPFVYFHSIIDSPACEKNVVALDALETDLASAKTTPNYSMITPNLCNDGHDNTCADGSPGGLVSANTWLADVGAEDPRVAHVQEGRPADRDVRRGRSERRRPATRRRAATRRHTRTSTSASSIVPGPGGGRIGAVLLSPFVKPGSTSDTPYNHFAMLCSVEDLFGLKHLGYAAQPGLQCFGKDVYNKASG